MSAPSDVHKQLMAVAIEHDGAAQRALFAGDPATARAAFLKAADAYRRSWEAAPARSYGRLVGMLKSAVLAGDGCDEAAYVQSALGEEGADSPPAAYAQALAALISGDDVAARRWSEMMRTGSEPFIRAADAIEALASADGTAYRDAVETVVGDFEQRTEHLTGVAVADTALMLQCLAVRRGLAAELDSPLLPGPAR